MFAPVLRYAERTGLRLLDASLNSSFAEEAVTVALRSRLVDAVARECVRSGVLDRVLEPFVASNAVERLVDSAIDTPAARRIVTHVIESGVVDEATTRLLESEELWVLVDEIASSPAVTDAISHQSVGLVDQVAGVVRDRSRNADVRMERVARRVLRRRPRAARE
jgi:hypothetical protein